MNMLEILKFLFRLMFLKSGPEQLLHRLSVSLQFISKQNLSLCKWPKSEKIRAGPDVVTTVLKDSMCLPEAVREEASWWQTQKEKWKHWGYKPSNANGHQELLASCLWTSDPENHEWFSQGSLSSAEGVLSCGRRQKGCGEISRDWWNHL